MHQNFLSTKLSWRYIALNLYHSLANCIKYKRQQRSLKVKWSVVTIDFRCGFALYSYLHKPLWNISMLYESVSYICAQMFSNFLHVQSGREIKFLFTTNFWNSGFFFSHPSPVNCGGFLKVCLMPAWIKVWKYAYQCRICASLLLQVYIVDIAWMQNSRTLVKCRM